MYVDSGSEQTRRLMSETSHARTIVVTSGKGGVGKSNMALNISALLSSAGNRVALVDADMGMANLDVLADVNPIANISHVINGTRTLDEIIVDMDCGVQLIPGASGLAEMARLSEFQRASLLRQLSTLETSNDVIVVDTGAGIGADVVTFAASAEKVLVVTTPEPTAITDAYGMIKVLSRTASGEIALLVNMAQNRHEARMVYDRVSDVARRFLGVRVLFAGYVPWDAKVGQAVRKRTPFVIDSPTCQAARCVGALANKLSPISNLSPRRSGFFQRVTNWFAQGSDDCREKNAKKYEKIG